MQEPILQLEPLAHATPFCKTAACPRPLESAAVAPLPSSNFHQPTRPVLKPAEEGVGVETADAVGVGVGVGAEAVAAGVGAEVAGVGVAAAVAAAAVVAVDEAAVVAVAAAGTAAAEAVATGVTVVALTENRGISEATGLCDEAPPGGAGGAVIGKNSAAPASPSISA